MMDQSALCNDTNNESSPTSLATIKDNNNIKASDTISDKPESIKMDADDATNNATTIGAATNDDIKNPVLCDGKSVVEVSKNTGKNIFACSSTNRNVTGANVVQKGVDDDASDVTTAGIDRTSNDDVRGDVTRMVGNISRCVGQVTELIRGASETVVHKSTADSNLSTADGNKSSSDGTKSTTEDTSAADDTEPYHGRSTVDNTESTATDRTTVNNSKSTKNHQSSAEDGTKSTTTADATKSTAEDTRSAVDNAKSTAGDSKNMVDGFQCRFCPNSFDSDADRLKHEQGHKQKSPLLKCDICSQKFKRKSQLEQHVASHDSEKSTKRFKCDLCQKEYGRKDHLWRHASKTHTGYLRCRFLDCLCIFDNESDREAHESTHKESDKPRNKYQCEQCLKFFSNSTNLNRHRNNACSFIAQKTNDEGLVEHKITEHDGKESVQLKCRYCSEMFLTPLQVREHETSHTRGKTHMCLYCGATFSQIGTLQLHEMEKHMEEQLRPIRDTKKPATKKGTLSSSVSKESASYPTSTNVLMSTPDKSPPPSIPSSEVGKKMLSFKCRYCSQQFAEMSSMRHHELNHSKGKMFECDYCNATFSQKGTLKLHEMEKHMDEEFRSNVKPVASSPKTAANVSSPKSANLKASSSDPNDAPSFAHRAIANGKYYCNKCHESFSNESDLETHMETHPTCLSCGKKFANDKGLQTHIRLYHSGNDMECPTCGKVFSDEAQLKSHVVFHEENQPYRCDKCDGTYKNKWALQQHQVLHSNQIFKCPKCGKEFKHPDSLRRHQRLSYCKAKQQEGYKCHQCKETYRCQVTFDSEDELDQHIAKHHQKEYKCSMCKQTFVEEESLIKHEANKSLCSRYLALRDPKGDEMYRCNDCKEHFDDIISLGVHMCDSAGLQCGVCQETCNNSQSLKEHQKIHMEEDQTFACELCGEVFDTRVSFAAHQESHKIPSGTTAQDVGEKFTCGYCISSFMTMDSLKEHLKDCFAYESNSTLSDEDTEMASNRRKASSSHPTMTDPSTDIRICSRQRKQVKSESPLVARKRSSSVEDAAQITPKQTRRKTEQLVSTPARSEVGASSSASPKETKTRTGRTVVTPVRFRQDEFLDDSWESDEDYMNLEVKETVGKVDSDPLSEQDMSEPYKDNRFSCSQCSISYSEPQVLHDHERKHKGIYYRCKRCSGTYTWLSSIHRHVRKAHDISCTKNEYCDVIISDKSHDEAEHLTADAEVGSSRDKKKDAIKENNEKDMNDQPRSRNLRCTKCPATYTDARGLSDHERKHKGIFYQCKKCDVTFVWLSSVHRHAKKIHGICYNENDYCDIIKSENCLEEVSEHSLADEEDSTSRDTKKDALKETEEEEEEADDVDDASLEDDLDSTTKVEMQAIPRGTVLNCSYCSASYSHAQVLFDHERKHRNIFYQCKTCCKTFPWLSGIKRHIRNKHGIPCTENEYCDFVKSDDRRDDATAEEDDGNSRDAKKDDVKGNDDKKEETVNAMADEEDGNSKDDVQENDDKKKETGDADGYSLKSGGSKSTTNVPKPKRPKGPDNKVGPREYVCTECSVSYTDVHSFRDHERKHKGLLYQCNRCSMTFVWLSGVRRHVRIKHGMSYTQIGYHDVVKPITSHDDDFQCNECSLTFKGANGLQRHRHIHMRNFPLKCRFCTATFNQKVSLDSHEKCHQNASQSPSNKDESDLRMAKSSFDAVEKIDDTDTKMTKNILDAVEKIDDTDTKMTKNNLDAVERIDDTDTEMTKNNLDAVEKIDDTDTKMTKNNSDAEEKIDDTDTKITKSNLDAVEKMDDIDSRMTKSNSDAAEKINDTDTKIKRSSLDPVENKGDTEAHKFQCKQCLFIFKGHLALKRHQIVHNRNQKFKCRHCSASYNKEIHLLDHELVHASGYRCKLCNKSFRWSVNLIRHVKLMHSVGRGKKHRHLGNITGNRQHLLRSRSSNETSETEKSSDKTKAIDTHSKNILGMTKVHKFQCRKCLFVFRGPRALARHQRVHTRNQKFRCRYCTASYNVKRHLLDHEQLHFGGYQCKICKKTFKWGEWLQRHMQTHETAKKSLTSKRLRSRTGKERAETSYINKREVTESFGKDRGNVKDITEAKQVAKKRGRPQNDASGHGNGDSKKQKTNGTTSDKADMKKKKEEIPKRLLRKRGTKLGATKKDESDKSEAITKVIHKKIYKFQCQECSFVFSKTDSLRQHQEVHTRNCKYKCQHCTASYENEVYLKEHEKFHRDIYSCKECQKTFKWKHTLKKHMECLHSVQSWKQGLKASTRLPKPRSSRLLQPPSTRLLRLPSTRLLRPRTEATKTEVKIKKTKHFLGAKQTKKSKLRADIAQTETRRDAEQVLDTADNELTQTHGALVEMSKMTLQKENPVLHQADQIHDCGAGTGILKRAKVQKAKYDEMLKKSEPKVDAAQTHKDSSLTGDALQSEMSTDALKNKDEEKKTKRFYGAKQTKLFNKYELNDDAKQSEIHKDSTSIEYTVQNETVMGATCMQKEGTGKEDLGLKLILEDSKQNKNSNDLLQDVDKQHECSHSSASSGVKEDMMSHEDRHKHPTHRCDECLRVYFLPTNLSRHKERAHGCNMAKKNPGPLTAGDGDGVQSLKWQSSSRKRTLTDDNGDSVESVTHQNSIRKRTLTADEEANKLFTGVTDSEGKPDKGQLPSNDCIRASNPCSVKERSSAGTDTNLQSGGASSIVNKPSVSINTAKHSNSKSEKRTLPSDNTSNLSKRCKNERLVLPEDPMEMPDSVVISSMDDDDMRPTKCSPKADCKGEKLEQELAVSVKAKTASEEPRFTLKTNSSDKVSSTVNMTEPIKCSMKVDLKGENSEQELPDSSEAKKNLEEPSTKTTDSVKISSVDNGTLPTKSVLKTELKGQNQGSEVTSSSKVEMTLKGPSLTFKSTDSAVVSSSDVTRCTKPSLKANSHDVKPEKELARLSDAKKVSEGSGTEESTDSDKISSTDHMKVPTKRLLRHGSKCGKPGQALVVSGKAKTALKEPSMTVKSKFTHVVLAEPSTTSTSTDSAKVSSETVRTECLPSTSVSEAKVEQDRTKTPVDTSSNPDEFKENTSIQRFEETKDQSSPHDLDKLSAETNLSSSKPKRKSSAVTSVNKDGSSDVDTTPRRSHRHQSDSDIAKSPAPGDTDGSFKCDECKIYVFKSAKSLARHKLMHTRNDKYKCSYCTASFKDSRHLCDHEGLHRQGGLYKCDICSKSFLWGDSLNKHMRKIHGGQSPFSQKKDNTPSRNPNASETPARSKTPTRPETPTRALRPRDVVIITPEGSSRKKESSRKKRKESRGTTDEDTCSPSLKQKDIASSPDSSSKKKETSYKKRKLSSETVKDKGIGSDPSLTQDSSKEGDIDKQKKYYKSVVGIETSPESKTTPAKALREHAKKKEKHSKSPAKSSGSEQDLPSPSKYSPGSEEIVIVDGKCKCPYCSKLLSRKDHVRRHVRNIHFNVDTPYRCAICGRRFSSTEELDKHRPIHTKSDSFTCDYCDEKTYTTLKALRRHEQIVHMEQADVFHCDECNEEFSRSCSLKVHVLRKHQGLKFICWPCSEGFHNKEGLTDHEKKCHVR